VGKPSLNAAQPYAKTEGRVFLLVPAYPGCPGPKAVKRLLLLLLSLFEMWIWQRMLKISWTEKLTNEEVLVRANEASSMLRMSWHGKQK